MLQEDQRVAAAPFKQVIAGESTRAQLLKLWGEPDKTRKAGGGEVLTYQHAKFSSVEVLVEEDRVELIKAKLEQQSQPERLAAKLRVDAITLGDHLYRRKQIYKILEAKENIVRPVNLPSEAIGRRWAVVKAKNGAPVGICCALGQLFMKPVDTPWRAVDDALSQMPSDVRVRLVDFHAEATSEMQIMGRYLDGRVSAVVGTHTHVATADEQVLPGGAAFQCDVGMTGPHDSIIGRRVDRVLETTLTSLPSPFDVATGDVRLNGAIIEVDPETGHAQSIRRLCVNEERAAQLAKDYPAG